MSASPRHVASGPSPATLTAPSSASYAPGSPTMAPRHLAPALNTQGAGGPVRAHAVHTTWPITPARPLARPRDGRASRGTAYHPPHHHRRRHRPFFSCPRRPRYRRRRPRRTRSRHHRPRAPCCLAPMASSSEARVSPMIHTSGQAFPLRLQSSTTLRQTSTPKLKDGGTAH